MAAVPHGPQDTNQGTVEQTFNFLEIRAMNTHPDNQVVIETDKSTYSLRLQSNDHLDQLISHINFALSRIFNNSIYTPSIFHADGDVTDGNRKFSPSSESSVETQRACGERNISTYSSCIHTVT
ncbi:hypothetical protein cypCar_00040253 [Cyprinus carpio]|nr:hypothetical protein cypCar_00040253 [Cyprinus carpio]